MKEAIAYIRVSTQRQGAIGGGLQDQASQIEYFAKQENCHIRDTYKDIATGGHVDPIHKRPGLRKALDEAKKHDLPLVVANPSRLTRSTEAMHRLITEENVEIIPVSVDGKVDPVSMQAHVHRAERHRRRISDRTREALAERKTRGVKLGNRTNLSEAQKLGSDANKKKADAFANNVLLVINKIQKEGFESLGAIAHRLNELGVPTRRSGKWYRKTVADLLRRVSHEDAEASPKKVKQDREIDHNIWGSW